jgi:moderate conductance mechanosensitive channel
MQQPTPTPTPPTLPPNFVEISAALAVTATLAIGGAIVIGALVRRTLTAWLGGDTPHERALINGVVRLTRFASLLLLAALVAFPAMDMAGVHVPDGVQSEQLWQWLASRGIRIVVILIIAALLVRLTAGVAMRAERDLGVGAGVAALEQRKRAQTVGNLVRRVLAVLIWTMAFLMVLRELDVDITPVLTGAGIVGLAVGFGAQTLVRDVITGFFLILEDQVRVGDVARVNGTGGLVEQLNLRTIVLRDIEGTVHVFPNGEIKTLANQTKDFSYYVIDLPMGYDDDTDGVVEAVRAAAADLAADPVFAASILEPLDVLGVDAFGDSSVTLKIRIKTVPLKQWEVGRELRRRIKKVFDQRGIGIPYPQLTVHFKRDQSDDRPADRVR